MSSIVLYGKVKGCYREYVHGRLVSFSTKPEESPELFALIQQALFDAGLYAPVKWFFGNRTGLHAVAYCEVEEVWMMLFVDLVFEEDQFFVKAWYDSFRSIGSANHFMMESKCAA